MNAVQLIENARLLPVAIVESVDEGLGLARALKAADLPLIEITCRTAAAEDAIAAVAREYPGMTIGAGTVIDGAQAHRVIEAGASFIVSPGLDEEVAAACAKRGIPHYPGVATATEVMRALRLGLRTLKFFPAESIGGAGALKALAGPFAHTGVKFVPTGGIQLDTAPAYWAIPQVAAVGGSWIVDKKLVQSENFAEVTSRTRDALAAAH